MVYKQTVLYLTKIKKMKKLFGIICIAFATIGAQAQNIDQGTFYISLGNAYSPISQHSYSPQGTGMSMGNEWVTGITIDGDDDNDNGSDYFGKDEKSSISNFNMTGRFGYFPTDGLLMGIGIEYSSYSLNEYDEYDGDGDGRDDEYTYTFQTNSFAISPFAKYYINLGSNALFLSSSYTFGLLNRRFEEEEEYTSMGYDYEDDGEYEPISTSRLDFGAGMAFFLTENIALEPSVNFAFNTYTQEEEDQFYNSYMGGYYYDDVEVETKTRAIYFKIAASMYF